MKINTQSYLNINERSKWQGKLTKKEKSRRKKLMKKYLTICIIASLKRILIGTSMLSPLPLSTDFEPNICSISLFLFPSLSFSHFISLSISFSHSLTLSLSLSVSLCLSLFLSFFLYLSLCFSFSFPLFLAPFTIISFIHDFIV